MSSEIWKNIPFIKGYEVSSFGRIKNTKRGTIRKLNNNSKKGYYLINLPNKTYAVHRLVAMVFIENLENKSQVNHIDGNKLNNNVNNLEWVTDKENRLHAKTTGLLNPPRGSRNGLAKLKESDILEIRKLFMSGKSQAEIGRLFNVDRRNIHLIVRGKAWNHV